MGISIKQDLFEKENLKYNFHLGHAWNEGNQPGVISTVKALRFTEGKLKEMGVPNQLD